MIKLRNATIWSLVLLSGVLPAVISAGSFTVHNTTNTEKMIKFDAIWCHRLGDSVPLTKEWWESKGVTGGVLGYTITGAGTNTDIQEGKSAAEQAAAAAQAAGIASGAVAGATGAGIAAGSAAGATVGLAIGTGFGIAAAIGTAAGPSILGAASPVIVGASVGTAFGVPLIIGGVVLGATIGGVTALALTPALGITALVLGILSADAEKQFSTRPCADGGKVEFTVAIAPGTSYSAGKAGVWYDVKLVNAEGTSFRGLQGELYDEFHVPADQDWKLTIE